MTSTPSLQRIFQTVTLGALCLACACATSRRAEPVGSAAPSNAAVITSEQQFAEPPPAAEAPAADEDRAAAAPGSPVVQSAPAAAPPSRMSNGAAAGHTRPTAAAAPKRAAEAESLSPSKKSKAENKDLLTEPDDLAKDPLSPSVKDPTELRVALQDWSNAADQLATSQGCNDGCRAFQSMQRAAARICNLVFNQDPAQRCAAAKSRISEAERNLSQRCGKCER